MDKKVMRWICPNCGEHLFAFEDDEGYARCICARCRVVMVMKRKSRRKQLLEINAPYGTEVIEYQ